MQPATESKSIEQAFQPAFEEIARRREATTAGTETLHFAATDDECLPFHVPGQRVALVSLGTAVLAPVPKDHSRPALRVYGCFEDKDKAREHAALVQQLDPACSLVAVSTHEWLLMPITDDARDDADVQRPTRRAQAAGASGGAARGGRGLPPRRARGRGAAHGGHRAAQGPEDAEMDEAEALVYKPPKRLRAGAEVRGQAAVALCVVPDEFGECLVKILGCFETASEADVWVRNVASRHVTEDDVLVAPTCEWLYPNGKTTGNEHYRSGELQRIMDASRRNVRAVKDYKEWKREQDALKAAEAEA